MRSVIPIMQGTYNWLLLRSVLIEKCFEKRGVCLRLTFPSNRVDDPITIYNKNISVNVAVIFDKLIQYINCIYDLIIADLKILSCFFTR